MYEPPSDLPETMQHYLRMWNELDLEKLRGHLNQAVSDDCLGVDPQNDHAGRDALEANVREFRTKFPTAELNLASRVDHHHERYCDEWVTTMDGKVLMPGFDVVTLGTSGPIERVDGFFGVLERTD